jgi:hypothetical protein
MKSLKLIILLLLFPVLLIAQFREGYIITNENDTVSGYINFEGSVVNSNQCAFKKNENDQQKIYKPGDIKAFRFINGKYFISSEILINETLQKVFLEWLIKGKASILSYSPVSLEVRYFIAQDNDSLCELKNSSVVKKIDGVNYEIERKEYVGLLKYKMNDCPQLFNTITTMPFSGNSMIKVSKKYHDLVCNDEECIIFEDKSRKLDIALGVSLGYVNSVLEINRNPYEAMNTVNTVTGGFYVAISNLPFLSPKMSFQTGINFMNALYQFDCPEPMPINDDRVSDVQTLKIPLMFKYNFFTSGFSPFIELGLVSNLRPSYHFYNEYIASYITRHYSYYYRDMRFLQVGFMGGAGLTYTLPTNVGFNLAANYEYSPRFIGTYPADKTLLKNWTVTASVFYKISNKKK